MLQEIDLRRSLLLAWWVEVILMLCIQRSSVSTSDRALPGLAIVRHFDQAVGG